MKFWENCWYLFNQNPIFRLNLNPILTSSETWRLKNRSNLDFFDRWIRFGLSASPLKPRKNLILHRLNPHYHFPGHFLNIRKSGLLSPQCWYSHRGNFGWPTIKAHRKLALGRPPLAYLQVRASFANEVIISLKIPCHFLSPKQNIKSFLKIKKFSFQGTYSAISLLDSSTDWHRLNLIRPNTVLDWPIYEECELPGAQLGSLIWKQTCKNLKSTEPFLLRVFHEPMTVQLPEPQDNSLCSH